MSPDASDFLGGIPALDMNILKMKDSTSRVV